MAYTSASDQAPGDESPALTPRESRIGLFYADFVKRSLDILLVLVMLPIAIPVLAICALIIRLDGGPAFFTQERVGRHGRVFKCMKLRSMVIDADMALATHLNADPDARAEWESRQKLLDDPRVTRFGLFLRRSSIDELPQLWNVLTGDMSLVGPRPFTKAQIDLYTGRAYYKLRPGITGRWQVHARSKQSFLSRVHHDELYFSEISLWTDLTIILRTFGAIARMDGV